MKAINLKNIIVVALLINMGTGFSWANGQEVLEVISKKEAEFEFKDVTITEALDKIGQVARVEIVLSDEARWKLPHGEATRLSASLKGSLAECLTEMLNAFFMRYAVSEDKITVYPRKELEHILGRPSTKQLELLNTIYSMRMTFSDVSTEFVQNMINKWFEGVSFLPYEVPQRISVMIEMNSPDKESKGVSLAVLLEQVCGFDEWSTWYISGMDFPNQSPMIKLVREKEYREAVLDQIVDISFEGRRADRAEVILQRLAGWAGMELIIHKEEPSWLEDKIVVNMQNIKLRQALRNIVSSVDGEIDINIDDNVIEISGPIQSLMNVPSPGQPKSAGSSGEGYVGKISIPIGEGEGKYFIEFMLRERDLTEELRKLRENKIKQILKKFSKIDSSTVEVTFNPQSYTILN